MLLKMELTCRGFPLEFWGFPQKDPREHRFLSAEVSCCLKLFGKTSGKSFSVSDSFFSFWEFPRSEFCINRILEQEFFRKWVEPRLFLKNQANINIRNQEKKDHSKAGFHIFTRCTKLWHIWGCISSAVRRTTLQCAWKLLSRRTKQMLTWIRL